MAFKPPANQPSTWVHVVIDKIKRPTKAYMGVGTMIRVNDLEIVVMCHSTEELLRAHALLGGTNVFDESKCVDTVALAANAVEEEL